MSVSHETIYPYYNKWDTPKLQSQFHKAVFNGRTAKVRILIAAGANIYATTEKDENPLYIAIARDHLAIVNQILDIYEEDLHFVRQFFKSRHNMEWTQRPVFIAHGSDHIGLVKELSTDMEILPVGSVDKMQGMIILLKSFEEKEILWLRPNCREDDIRIAKIIECIWADGVIDLCHKGHWGRTVIEAAAIRNQPDLYCRLHSMVCPDPQKSIEHFLQLCRHQQGKLEFFKQLLGKTGQQFDISDILATTSNALVLPAYYNQIEIFHYFLESLANRTAKSENRETTMTDILQTYKISDTSTLMESIIWADCNEFLEQCLLRFKPNLLLIGANDDTLLESMIRQKPSKFMTQFIVEYFDKVLAAGMEYKIVKRLIKGNWVDAVKSLYDRYSSCRCVLFRNREKGVKYLLNAIDGCHYNLANYLIDAHRLDLSDPDDVIQLILYCSFVQRSYEVLKTLLSLPAADPVKLTSSEHYYKSPIYVALKFRHLKNFQLLLANVADSKKFRDLKEDNGENLLFVAIWFKENPVDETPFVYVDEEKASLEIVDSSDDEDEADRKRVHNERLLTSTGPINDPIMPDSYFVEQRIEVNRIFNYLLNEVGLDYRCVNNSGETLLHLAVKRDNYEVVKQLLALGLDPHSKDIAGNCPAHALSSSSVLNILRDYKCDFNVTNSVGETPLLAYVKGATDYEDVNLQDRETFLIELLRAGADINHADTNGLTALHIVKSTKIAKILLQYGAEINAKNVNGETPLLYIFHQQIQVVEVQNLYKLFLSNRSLDIMAVSNNGISILSVLVSLDEMTMADVLTAFAERSNSIALDDLFNKHCNGVDYNGNSVLVTSCSEHTNSYCLDKLLNISHLDANTNSEYQPFEAAVQNINTIERLINRGANVNGNGNCNRKTPLMYAIEERSTIRSNFATTALLLAAGCDVEVMDEKGDTALNYACRLENSKDARRTIAALILANVNYYRQCGESQKLPLTDVEPFNCFYDRRDNYCFYGPDL